MVCTAAGKRSCEEALLPPSRGVRLEHEVIVHCKASPDIRVIDAIAVILKDERVARGIEMK